MEEICKERKYVSILASISLTQAHGCSIHDFSNILSKSFKKIFSWVYFNEKKCGIGDFRKEMPFINSGEVASFHAFHVLWMLLM